MLNSISLFLFFFRAIRSVMVHGNANRTEFCISSWCVFTGTLVCILGWSNSSSPGTDGRDVCFPAHTEIALVGYLVLFFIDTCMGSNIQDKQILLQILKFLFFFLFHPT